MDKVRQRLDDFFTFFSTPVSWHYEDKVMMLKNSDRSDDERLFEELTFCLLTANTSAAMSMRAVDSLRPILFSGTYEELRDALISSGYRFPNKRAEYIIEARGNFSGNLKKLIESKEKTEMREFLVNNVRGIGYKEASHFLRNVGVRGLAILDKHILRSMHEKGLIDSVPKSLNQKKYLEHESILKGYSDKEKIDFDELDLILWSGKNGDVMK